MGSVWLMSALWVALSAPALPGVPDDAVVGRAKGPAGPIQITAARLRAYAAQHPERPLDAALRDLIDFELLAAVAEQQGVADSREVREAEAKVMVRAYLKRDFEQALTEATIPQDFLQKAYEQNRRMFVAPELRKGVHVVVGVKDDSGRPQRPSNPLLDAQAQDWVKKIRAKMVADGVSDPEAFLKAHEPFVEGIEAAGLVIKAQSLPAFPKKGVMDQKFADAAFELDLEVLSAPFDSRFGWHVVWLTEIRPAKNRTLAEVAPEIRPRVLKDARNIKLKELTNALAQKYDALINPEPLEQLEASRGAQ